jgi:hypothetical protein
MAALVVLSGCADRGPADTTATAAPTTAPSTTTPPTTPPVASSAGLLRAACDGTLLGSSTAPLADDLTSISGLAAGRRRGDLVWAVEDSFEPADLVALRADGTELGRVRVRPGALANIDWEDLAVTTAPDGTPQVWIADIGDNLTIRPTVQLYVADEPDPTDATVDAQVIDLTYTDATGAAVRPNAEAMVVADGVAWIVDKVTDGPSTIYRMVPDGADPTQATMVPAGSLDLDGEAVTALDLSADGTVLALRTSTALRLYPVAAGQDIAAALAGTPCRVPAPDEAQGEAVAILPGDGGLLTVSESEAGDPVRLHRLTPR